MVRLSMRLREWEAISKEPAEKVRAEQESNTSGAKARRMSIVYGPTKEAAEKHTERRARV